MVLHRPLRCSELESMLGHHSIIAYQSYIVLNSDIPNSTTIYHHISVLWPSTYLSDTSLSSNICDPITQRKPNGIYCCVRCGFWGRQRVVLSKLQRAPWSFLQVSAPRPADIQCMHPMYCYRVLDCTMGPVMRTVICQHIWYTLHLAWICKPTAMKV